jgi:hypothetical protein
MIIDCSTMPFYWGIKSHENNMNEALYANDQT